MEKIHSVPMGRLAEVIEKLSDPELWAKKIIGLDYTLQKWPNRKAMARSIRMQQSRAPRQSDWTPIVKLTDGEGY